MQLWSEEQDIQHCCDFHIFVHISVFVVFIVPFYIPILILSSLFLIIRSKENTEDYRYFPCPDLPPVLICKNDVLKIKSSQEESIIEKILRFQNDYKLSFIDANRICNSQDMANFYEAIVSKISNPNEAKNLILGEISSILKNKNIKIDELPISLN